LIGAPAVRVVAILEGVDGHGLHIELGGGTDDAGCNFTAVGCWIGTMARWGMMQETISTCEGKRA
jgi:hypothetical protein